MKTSNVLTLIIVLLCINASTEWPTHTVCKEENLEIHYKSCDPQQDFAFSIDRCSDITTQTFNVRAAMVLRHSIKKLYVKVDLIINGKTVLSYSETLCEPGHSKLIFCGKNKGGMIPRNSQLVQQLVFSGIRCPQKECIFGLGFYSEHASKIVFGNKNGERGMNYSTGYLFWSLEHLYYEGPVTLGLKEIPQGDYTVSARLTNEDGVTVACADFTVKNYLDYYY